MESKITKTTGVRPARHRLQLVDDLHRSDLWRARDAAPRETFCEGGQMSHAGSQSPFDRRDQMLHLRVTLEAHEFGHLHGPILADTPEVIAQEVGDHYQFGHFLGTGLEFVGELGVAGRIAGTRARSFDGSRGDLRST